MIKHNLADSVDWADPPGPRT